MSAAVLATMMAGALQSAPPALLAELGKMALVTNKWQTGDRFELATVLKQVTHEWRIVGF